MNEQKDPQHPEDPEDLKNRREFTAGITAILIAGPALLALMEWQGILEGRMQNLIPITLGIWGTFAAFTAATAIRIRTQARKLGKPEGPGA